jgi:hypothetical protein
MGSKPSQKRPDVPLTCLPPIKWVSSFTVFPGSFLLNASVLVSRGKA